MADLKISIPYALRDYVDAQVRSGRYATASDFIRDLVRARMDRDGRAGVRDRLLPCPAASAPPPEPIEELHLNRRRPRRALATAD